MKSNHQTSKRQSIKATQIIHGQHAPFKQAYSKLSGNFRTLTSLTKEGKHHHFEQTQVGTSSRHHIQQHKKAKVENSRKQTF